VPNWIAAQRSRRRASIVARSARRASGPLRLSSFANVLWLLGGGYAAQGSAGMADFMHLASATAIVGLIIIVAREWAESQKNN
jgi:hypothetical protein